MNSGPLGAVAWNVVSREGVDTGRLIAGGDMGITLWPQPSGFLNIRSPPSGTSLAAYASDGTRLRSEFIDEDTYSALDVAPDPQGGVLLVKWAPAAGDTEVLTMQFLDATGLPRTEPTALVSEPRSDERFVTAGVDTLGHVLVLWGELGDTRWTGQWLNRNGEPLTERFMFRAPASAGRVWSVLSPLADGGLALRIDRKWISRFPSGEAKARPAPEWLVSHPGAELFLIRGQRANVLVPPPALIEGTGCQQSLLFFASDGTPCGELPLVMEGGACLGTRLSVGRDGTVIQLRTHTGDQCAWRWWPKLLK